MDHQGALLDAPSLTFPQQNLSFVLQKAKHVSFEDRPVPKLQSPHDVIINVQWTGICGSDVHYWFVDGT